MEKFFDREEAGRALAKELEDYANRTDVIALALPRGGVPIAFEIATHLSIPMNVFIVRKLGVPWHKELAMGAICSGGITLLNNELIKDLGISSLAVDQAIEEETIELERRERLYGITPISDLKDKTILLVDDGIATGYTIKTAILGLRPLNLAQIIIAVPVAALDTFNELSKLADQIICPLKPENFIAVGLWYEHFPQVNDEEVCQWLKNAKG